MKAAVVVAVYWVVLFYSDGATVAIAIYSCGTTSLDLLSRNIIIIGRNMNAAQQTTQQSAIVGVSEKKRQSAVCGG